MIKKIILAVMVLMMTISISLAAGPQGIHEPGTGLANDTNVSASTPGIHEPGTGITNPEMKEAAQSAKQTETPAQKTQPGFDAIFALTGLIAVAFIALRRGN